MSKAPSRLAGYQWAALTWGPYLLNFSIRWGGGGVNGLGGDFLGGVHGLYGDLVVRLVGAVADGYPDIVEREVVLVASRRETNKHLNRVFCERVRDGALREYGVRVEVVVRQAFLERGLQVADAVVWGVFRKWEFGDGRWCEMLGGKLRETIWKK